MTTKLHKMSQINFVADNWNNEDGAMVALDDVTYQAELCGQLPFLFHYLVIHICYICFIEIKHFEVLHWLISKNRMWSI